jgi:hypothetical protein
VNRFRILLIGAYGQFGSRIASQLADDNIDLVLGGRNINDALALKHALQPRAHAVLSAVAIDCTAASLSASVAAIGPDLVIHTAGPFQAQDDRVARATLAAGAHYIDLADARDFVCGIGRLDGLARAAGRWVISGASSVPGLSAAVVDAHLPRFQRLEAIETAISPGNRTARGLATTTAILGYVGKPIPMRRAGGWTTGYGWQSCRRLAIPGVGHRWVARCDVPDLALLPARYPALQTCDFRAGLELRRMQFGLWAASWLVRAGVVRSLQPWAAPLLRLSESWQAAGSDTGAMLVDMTGIGVDGRPLHLRWRIVARAGSGPQIPASAAVVIARKLQRQEVPGAGARACLDFFSLEEFLAALAAYPIETGLEVAPSR